jgi:hypothetical protein
MFGPIIIFALFGDKYHIINHSFFLYIYIYIYIYIYKRNNMLSTVTNNMFIGLFPDFNHYYGVYKNRGYFLVENSIFLK